MWSAPDPGWLPFVKMTFGFILLLALTILSGVIAVKKVEAATSFGLEIILGGLLTLSGGFVQWAFGGEKPNKADDKVEADNKVV